MFPERDLDTELTQDLNMFCFTLSVCAHVSFLPFPNSCFSV